VPLSWSELLASASWVPSKENWSAGHRAICDRHQKLIMEFTINNRLELLGGFAFPYKLYLYIFHHQKCGVRSYTKCVVLGVCVCHKVLLFRQIPNGVLNLVLKCIKIFVFNAELIGEIKLKNLPHSLHTSIYELG
jgi:hypothetical protein